VRRQILDSPSTLRLIDQWKSREEAEASRVEAGRQDGDWNEMGRNGVVAR